MSTFSCASDALALFAQCLKKVPDPRSKQGTSHPCSSSFPLRGNDNHSSLGGGGPIGRRGFVGKSPKQFLRSNVSTKG